MSSRNSAPSLILLSFVLLALCIFPGGNYRVASSNSSSVAPLESFSPALAQKGPNVVAGAPLKGCDVKLGRPPGGSPAARTTTDGKGKFSFGVVPKGSYFLTLDFESKGTGNPVRGSEPVVAEVKALLITLDGAVGGQIQRGWDVKNKKPLETASQTTAKSQEKIVIESDGQTPLTGIVQTAIVKSKSNITNN